MLPARKQIVIAVLSVLLSLVGPMSAAYADPQNAPFTLDSRGPGQEQAGQGETQPDPGTLELRLSGVKPIDTRGSQSFSASEQPEGLNVIAAPSVPLLFGAFRLSGPISLPRLDNEDVTGAVRETELRIGDILSISLPGENAFNKEFKVDRRGELTLPEAGTFHVAGLSLSQAREEVKTRLARVYRDLERLSVVIKERRLLINVLGYVKTPGLIELPGDATVQTAIAAAGGLAQGAQLDRFKVRRGDQDIVFDYKKYLDSGDIGIIPELRPLDTIFVPASPRTGNVQIDFDGRTLSEAGDGAEDRSAIKIFGEVNKPGTFAYKDGANVVDVIMRAGGVTRYSTIEQIHVLNDGKPTLFNLETYLQSGQKASLPDLRPGATIFVPKQSDQVKQGSSTIFVMGEVQKPGGFDATSDANFIGLLANAGGPTRFAETNAIRVLHPNGSVTNFNLPAYSEGKGGELPTVRPGDAIFVPGKQETNEPSWLKVAPSRAVQMIGAVNRPGRVEWSDEMSLLDLISQAGGPTAVGDVANIQILTHEGANARSIRFNLEKFIAEGGPLAQLPKIHAGYVVLMPVLPISPNDTKGSWGRLTSDVSIYIMGQVGIPGRYAFNNGLHFLDILSAANGPTGAADIRNIRVSHRGRKGSYVSKVDLARYFETGDDSLLPKVRPGDVIFVPDRNKEWVDERKEATIRVLGAVAKPGRYRWSDDMTILDLLAEAGGPRADALDHKILVVNFKADGEQARLFNLLEFAKTADITKLPIIRAGDMVYVPNTGQSELKVFTDILQSGSSIASIGALIYTLGIK